MEQVRQGNRLAFTLIELLTVIAIIGILAGILVPAVGQVRKKTAIATSKAKIAQYVTALEGFKAEYGYYPFTQNLDANGLIELDTPRISKMFVETLSARSINDTNRSVSGEGNRRRIQIYVFTDSEISDGLEYDAIKANTVIDSFGNNKICFVFDHNGDGVLTVPDPDGSKTAIKKIRGTVAAYVKENSAIKAPSYYLYD
jgi:prepilin-type N-terminal cleavage/methylation domain-containing protein